MYFNNRQILPFQNASWPTIIFQHKITKSQMHINCKMLHIILRLIRIDELIGKRTRINVSKLYWARYIYLLSGHRLSIVYRYAAQKRCTVDPNI